MKTTLISLIGTGMYDDTEGGYRTTTYQFQEGTQYTTHLFLEALIKSKLYDFTEIFIVGTKTSDWGVLIAENSEKYQTLSESLLSDRILEEDGITEKNALLLEEALNDIYGIRFKLFYHTSTVDNENVEEIFNIYKELSKQIDKNSKIIFDITHGFRSMPVLLYQTLQYSFENSFEGKISLIYGEYIRENDVSLVRDLSRYLEYAEISTGFNLFNERFDGKILAEKSEEAWPEGSKWLKRFTNMVQANYFLQIPEILNNLTNILNNKRIEKPYSWVADLYATLDNIKNRLSKYKNSRLIYEFSKMLYEKRLYTQAVIALQVTVESFALEESNNLNMLGDYEFYKNKIKCDFRKKLRQEYKDTNKNAEISRLEHLRNNIAHGGSIDPSTKSFPKAENIERQYNSAIYSVGKLLKKLKD